MGENRRFRESSVAHGITCRNCDGFAATLRTKATETSNRVLGLALGALARKVDYYCRFGKHCERLGALSVRSTRRGALIPRETAAIPRTAGSKFPGARASRQCIPNPVPSCENNERCSEPPRRIDTLRMVGHEKSGRPALTNTLRQPLPPKAILLSGNFRQQVLGGRLLIGIAFLDHFIQ